MKLLAAFAAAALLASPSTTPAQNAARYLDGRESAAGGFAEPGAAVTPGLSAWVAIGLRASGRSTADLERLRAYLVSTEAGLASATDMELALVARASLGDPAPALVERVRSLKRRNGAIGPSINSTICSFLIHPCG